MLRAEEASILRQRILQYTDPIRQEEVQEWFKEELDLLELSTEHLQDTTLKYLLYLKENNIIVANYPQSAIAYAIHITNDKPTKPVYMKSEGGGLCDIDTDFCKKRRDEVIQYVRNKYGKDRVTQIGTYAEFKPRGTLRNFARVLGYPYDIGDKLANMVPPDIAGKALKFDKVIESEPKLLDPKYEQIVTLARKAEGLKYQAGVHAAGIVISDKEMMSLVPLFRGKHDEVATQFDMHDAEGIGLVKFDLLGLKTLTVIQETLDIIKEHKNINIDISRINTEDQKVFKEVFQTGKVDGIFQFEQSSGFKDLCVKIKPINIEDLSCITALYRPGPLGSGQTKQYVDCRNGKEPEYFIPELEPILRDTYGVIVYQEQIIKIATDIAGYNLPEADILRKIVGKKLPDKMKLERDKFVSGCTKNNIEEEKAGQLFDYIEGFSKYGFNSGHSISYSVISYQTAWLKTYYKHEFYTALLNNSIRDQDDIVKYVNMCSDDEIPIQPPDVNLSQVQFTLNNDTIIFGLAGVKGMGESTCTDLMEKRKKAGGFKSLEDLVRAKVDRGVIRSLAACGALSEIEEGNYRLPEEIDILADYYDALIHWEDRNKRIAEREELRRKQIEAGEKPERRLPQNNKECPKKPIIETNTLSKTERLALERDTLGFYITGHPLDEHHTLRSQASTTISKLKDGSVLDGDCVQLCVVISSINKKRTKKQQDMAILNIEDKTGRIEAAIFPKQWKNLQHILDKENCIGIVNGTVKLTYVDEDSEPLVRLIINNILINNKEIKAQNIKVELADGTTVEFIPIELDSYSKYQQAVAIAKNIRSTI